MSKSPENNVRPARPRAEIREMEIEDLAAVFALGERLFTPGRTPTLYRTWDEYELLECYVSDGDTCLVAETDDRIVGFAIGVLIEKRRTAWTYGYLTWIGVDPELERGGVGRRLLRRLTELFVERGARMMLVDTDASNESALSFFRREGFGNEAEHIYLFRNLTQQPEAQRRRRKNGAS